MNTVPESFRAEPPSFYPPALDEPGAIQVAQSRAPKAVPSEALTADERISAVWCHLGGLLTWLVLPIILWQMKKDQSSFVDEHGKEAVNFQLTVTLFYVVGFLVFPLVLAYEIIVIVLAAGAAQRGEQYRYPLTIRFIK